MSPRCLERELGCDSWWIPVPPAPPLAPFPAHPSPEQAQTSPARVPERGDSCASIFIQNSQESWMERNYLGSINQD